jgi:predicted DNA-binding transcriptional regulator YafY
MGINKNAIIRYKTLDRCFANKYKKFYIDDLIEACCETLSDHYLSEVKVSRRQIFDDINFMKSNAGYDAPIVSKKDGKRVYYRYEEENYSIQNQQLTYEELELINNTLEIFSRVQGLSSINDLDVLEAKILASKDQLNADKPIISFDANPYLKGLEFLTPLYNYIKNQQVLKISYKSFKYQEQYDYIISPYHLKQYNNRWFLFGWNHAIEKIQNLPLDRILTIVTDSVPYIKTSVNFNEYFDDIIGVTNDEMQPIKRIKIKLSDHILPYLASKPIHHSQIISGNILTIKVKINYELESIILSYAEHLTILEPASLVEIINTRSQLQRKNYECS